MSRRHELPERPGLSDDRPQLSRSRHERCDVVGREDSWLGGLDDEHALKQAAIHDGHAEKRSVGILAGLAEILESRVRRRVGDELRPQLFRHKTGQPLAQTHPDPAHALGSQTDGCRQHEVCAVGLEQVGGADVGMEPVLHELDDVLEGFRGVSALRNQRADLVDRPERFAVVAGHARWPSKNAASAAA